MKKTFITCLALLAISLCLFVSCSAENTAANEMNDVAYVTFGRDSRDFSASYMVQSYDELYWFYTAEKADNYGTTGQITTLKEAPSKENGKGIGSGTVGPFSQGKWTFTLSAYASLNEDKTPKTETCVYKSEEISVTLTGGETKAIPVTVSPVGETGLIKFKDAYFQYKDGGEEASKFMIRAVGKSATYELSNDEDYITSHDGTIRIRLTKNGNEYIIAFVEQDGKLSDSISTPVDYYTCTAYAYLAESTTPLATCTFGLSVYGNATTVVSGPLTENPDSKVSFDVAASDIKTFLGSNTEKKVEVKVAPVSGQSTTVDFNNANNIDKNATYAVNVEALSANAASDAFAISSISEDGKQKETLGSVKLSLTQIKDGIAKDVKEFGGYVTVSTYIGEGLASDSISVVYNGDGAAPVFNGDGLGYDSKTGIITFRTNHFSEFFIVRDGNVYNENQNRYYYSLEDAINKANTNEQLVLMNSTSLNKVIEINKSIAIELNKKTLTIKQVVLLESDKEYTVAIKNGTIDGDGGSAFIQNSYSHLVLDDVSVNWQSQSVDAVCFINQGSNPVWLEVKNNSNLKNDVYGIGTNAGLGTDYVYVTVDNSTVTTTSSNEDNTAILFNVPGELKISNSTISGQRQGVIVRGGTATISNSTIISSGSSTEYIDYSNSKWGIGNEVPCAALVIGNRAPGSYKYETTVTLNNVKLETGEKAVRKAMYVYQESDDYPVTVLGSLSTDSERTINVIDGKENKAIVFPEAKIGDKYYNKFADAVLAAQQATNEDNKVVDVLTNKITVGTHSIEINGSVIINGNGADFYQNDGEQDVSVFAYNNNKGLVSKEQNVNIIINNAKNLRVWGNGSLIADNQKVKISLNDCSWDLSSKGFQNVDNIGMIMLRGANGNGSYQLEMNNCNIENTSKTDAIHGNIFSKVLINNCTFGNTARPINISHDLESDCTVTITGCIFNNCGEEGMNPNTNYSAPIRIVNKNENGSLKANIGNVTIDGTKSRDQMGDVLLCDCRNGKEYYALTANFSGCSELKVRNSSNNLITIENGANQDVLVSNQ